MHTNIFMYLTAMSAVSLHNLVSNINGVSQKSVNIKTANTNWTLEDTDLGNTFSQCNGARQSPIAIEFKSARENLGLRLGLTAYDKPISAMIVNRFPSFHLVPLSITWSRPSAIVSSSSARSFNPYADKHFVLSHVQFFWSNVIGNQDQASLHSIDSVKYPVEILLVHLNTIYPNLDEAYTKPDGLLILSVLVAKSSHESYVFDRLLDSLENITTLGDQVAFEEDTTWRSLLPTDTSSFYRYQGSLVMPPCHESVQWVVFDDKLRLGEKQLRRLSRFRFTSKNLKSGNQVEWSSQRRPLAKLDGRVVERSFGLRSNTTTNLSRIEARNSTLLNTSKQLN